MAFGVVFCFVLFFISLEIFCVALKVPNHYCIDLCIKKGMLGKEQEFPWLLSLIVTETHIYVFATVFRG